VKNKNPWYAINQALIVRQRMNMLEMRKNRNTNYTKPAKYAMIEIK
jgi:hypothetical protein